MSRLLQYLLLGLIVETQAECKFRFYIEHFTTQNKNEELIQTLTSRVMQLNNRSYLSTQLILKRIITDMDIKLTVDLIKPNNRTVRLINVRTNACDFLEKINKNLLFNILKNTLSKHLSGSLKCPFKPFFNYTLNNLFIDEKDFPSYVPECKIRGVGEVYFFQQLSAKFFFNAGVVHKPK